MILEAKILRNRGLLLDNVKFICYLVRYIGLLIEYFPGVMRCPC